MTSKGCVTNVAMAPAVAAEQPCTTAVLAPELGGTKLSVRNISKANEWIKRMSDLILA